MNNCRKDDEFDAIIVGSGTCGATIARELSKQKKKVLVLERGGNVPLRESFVGIVRIADQVVLGDGKLSTVRAITTGGSTSLYFAVANYPQLETFSAVGIDLSRELEAVRKELPIAQVSDELLGVQNRQLRDSAVALGHPWRKFDMLIDLSKCASGYSYASKWKARSYLEEAVQAGATLVDRAPVHRIIIEQNVAIGVEYRVKTGPLRTEVRRAFGTKIVLAAGEVATPKILRDAGIREIGDQGFYCNPGYAIYGLVPGMRGSSSFIGSMGCFYDEDIELGDASVPRPLHGPMMLGGLKLKHLFAFPESIGIGVKVKDSLGGELKADGRLRKSVAREDLLKLSKGKDAAIRILKQAGAGSIVDFGVIAAGRVGGMVRIQQHLDDKLETRYRNLHVCDGSVIPDDMRGTPTVTLVCLAKYLSGHLLLTL